MRRLAFMLMFQVFVCTIFAQSEISGRVFEKNGKVLIEANVLIENHYGGTITDLDGKFLFKEIKNGKYRIRVSYIGYQTQYKDIDLKESINLEFYLEKTSILADEVVISAIRAGEKTPFARTDINFEEIEGKNLGQDIPFLLQKVPSLVTTSDAGTGIGYSGLRIRGTSSSRINITINGVPLNDPESHDVYWVNLPDFISTVDNVQVQRGVGTSTNGAGAFGASINFQTFKFRKDPYAEIHSSAGSFNTFKNTVSVGSGLIKDKFTFNARLSKLNSDGYIDRAFADLKSFYLSGAYYSEKSILKININSGKEKTYQAWGGVPSDILESNPTYNPYTYDNEIDNYQQDHYQLHYSRELSKSLQLNTSLFYIKGRGYYEQYKGDKKFSDYGLENVITGDDTIKMTDLIQRKWLDNDYYGLTYSLNYTKKRAKINFGGSLNRYNGDHFGRIIWAKYASSGKIRHEWYNNNGLKTDFNIFTKISYSITSDLSLFGDIQYRNINYTLTGFDDDNRDISQDHIYNFINPKIGLYYKINDNQSTYFSFSTANREPNRSNLVDAEIDKEPGHETLYDFELGHEFKLANIHIATNFYYMNYKDQLVLTGEINDVGSAIMVNVPESYRAGIELVAGVKISKSFGWDLNFTLSKNKINNFIEYVDNWDTWSQVSRELGETDLSFSPSVVAASEITWNPVKNLNFSLMSKFVGKQYIDNTSSEERKLDSYFVNDIVVNYKIKLRSISELGFHFKLNNIFNEKYETNAWVYRYISEGKPYLMDGYFPQAGRNFLFGISLIF